MKPSLVWAFHILDTGTQILDTGYEKFMRTADLYTLPLTAMLHVK